jgi:hypothetical protein
MHFLYAVKLFLGSWLVVGVVTALGGLAWTCNISSRMLKDAPQTSSSD